MTSNQEVSEVRNIALDYYDGVTEGFALSLRDLGAVYFKLIAWDDVQDDRLFATVPIDKSVFEKISNLLSVDNQPSPSVWVTNPVFKNDHDDMEVGNIVESCQNDLRTKGILIKADAIDSETASLFELSDSLVESVEEALQNPGALSDWLIKLKK